MTSRTFAVVRHPHRGEPIVLSLASDGAEHAVTFTPMRAVQLARELLAAGMCELGGLHQPEQGFVQAHGCAESGEGRAATRPTPTVRVTEEYAIMATEKIYRLRPGNKPLSIAQKISRGLFRVSALAPWAAASVLLPVLWGLVFGALAIATFDQTLSLPLVFRLFTGTCIWGGWSCSLYLVGAEE